MASNPLSAALSQPYLGGSTGLTTPSMPKPGTTYKAPVTSSNGFDAQYASLLAQIDAANKALQSIYNRPAAPTAANYDYLGNRHAAQAQAASNINPLYIKLLNQFKTDQATALARQQADTTYGKSQLDQQLQDALDASGVNRTRTAQDVTTNKSDIANQEQNFQADTGQQFDQARTALARTGFAGGGNTDQLNQQSQQQNVQEGRQTQAFQQQKNVQDLLKSRTFEDLSRSDALNTRNTGQQQGRLDINLNRFIEDQGTALTKQQQELELKRQADIASQTPTYEKELFGQFLNSIKNTGVRAATQSAYGGLF